MALAHIGAGMCIVYCVYNAVYRDGVNNMFLNDFDVILFFDVLNLDHIHPSCTCYKN